MTRRCSLAFVMIAAGCAAHDAPPPPSTVMGASASKSRNDDAVAVLAAPCSIETDMACSSDGASLLQCKNGTMAEKSRCRGAKACAVVAGTPTCDRSIAEPGDACDAESETACTTKGDAVVQCRNKTMVQTTVCNCRVSVSGTSVRCAD